MGFRLAFGRRGEYRSAMRRHEAWYGVLFASPWIIGFLAFVAGPFVASFVLSFTSYKVGVGSEWVGLGNYAEMFGDDPLFWKSLYNTGYYVFLAVPLGELGSLLLAVMLNQKVRGIPVFRTMVYVPSIVSGVAVAYLWMWLLDPATSGANLAMKVRALAKLQEPDANILCYRGCYARCKIAIHN